MITRRLLRGYGLGNKCLRIPRADRGEHPTRHFGNVGDPVCTARRVLVAAIAQARHDGMTGVTFSVDPNTGEPKMQYYQTRRAGEIQYWEMISPPACVFPFLLQVIMTSAELSESIPIEGRITAREGFRKLHLRLRIQSGYVVDLSWEQEPGQRKRVRTRKRARFVFWVTMPNGNQDNALGSERT